MEPEWYVWGRFHVQYNNYITRPPSIWSYFNRDKWGNQSELQYEKLCISRIKQPSGVVKAIGA